MIVKTDTSTAPLDHGCAIRYPVRAVSATGGVNNNDYQLKVDATGGAVVINLPAAVFHPGRVLVIKKKDASANAVTPTRAGTDTINNAAATTFALATQDKYVMLQSDGVSAWDVISNN
jgi:hypothetical protein